MRKVQKFRGWVWRRTKPYASSRSLCIHPTRATTSGASLSASRTASARTSAFILPGQKPFSPDYWSNAALGFSLRMNFGERRLNPLRDRFSRTHCPEVHEKQPRLFCQHVTVQCGYLNVVLLEGGDHRIYFLGGENKITCCRHFTRTRLLKVDGLGHSLSSSKSHVVVSDRRGSWNPKRQNTTGKSALSADNIFNGL